jgi:hypothetical protein
MKMNSAFSAGLLLLRGTRTTYPFWGRILKRKNEAVRRAHHSEMAATQLLHDQSSLTGALPPQN